MDAGQIAVPSALTSTQIGAIGEAVVAAGLILASGGRLAPFKPFADDDGTDLLLFDKVTKRATPLQIKCRTGLDHPRHETVEFNVRLSTFAREGNGFLLGAVLDGASVKISWLVPAADLARIAARKPDKLVMVASAKTGSNDRYRPFRHDGLVTVARAIIDASAS